MLMLEIKFQLVKEEVIRFITFFLFRKVDNVLVKGIKKYSNEEELLESRQKNLQTFYNNVMCIIVSNLSLFTKIQKLLFIFYQLWI